MNAPVFVRRTVSGFMFAWSAFPSRRWRPSRVLLTATAFWLSTSSCVDRPVDPVRPLGPIAELQISASVSGTTVSTLVVTVSAPDIQPPLVYNIEVVNGSAVDNIAIPVGSGRDIDVRAVDLAGITTHEGSKRVDIHEGSNPSVSITLHPLVGDQPIDVRLGNRAIAVTPAVYLVKPGESVALSAVVTDLTTGTPIQVPPNEIRWASTNTRLATVDLQGRVTGESFGEVQIVASYGGAAGVARIAVAPTGVTILAAGDIGECVPPPTISGPPAQPSASALATGRMLDTLPGLVLALGDLAYPRGRTQDYALCYEPTWGRHKDRTRPVPGNHEYEAPTDTAYFDYWQATLGSMPFAATALDPTKGWYSFNYGSWHIIALNSEVPKNATSPQMDFLEVDLAATTAPCVLAFWHTPLFNSGTHHGNGVAMRPFWDTLYKYNADVVLSAHEHLYERFGPQTPVAGADPQRGIRQFTAGGGGTPDFETYDFAPVRRPNSEFGLAKMNGILEMVLGDNKYSWRYITAPDGIVRDVGVGTCH